MWQGQQQMSAAVSLAPDSESADTVFLKSSDLLHLTLSQIRVSLSFQFNLLRFDRSFESLTSEDNERGEGYIQYDVAVLMARGNHNLCKCEMNV